MPRRKISVGVMQRKMVGRPLKTVKVAGLLMVPFCIMLPEENREIKVNT